MSGVELEWIMDNGLLCYFCFVSCGVSKYYDLFLNFINKLHIKVANQPTNPHSNDKS